jgi:hypothetical protein
MKTVDIKGKPYIEVNERLKYFRTNYEGYRLNSEIVSCANGVVVMVARVIDPEGNTVATGHAYEKEGSTFINKTSYIENCETSAWGRALACFGIGIDAAVASADEVVNAIANQDEPVIDDKQLSQIKDYTDGMELDMDKFLKYAEADSLETIPAKNFGKVVAMLEKKMEKAS